MSLPPVTSNASAQVKLRAYRQHRHQCDVEALRQVMASPVGRRVLANFLKQLAGRPGELWSPSAAEVGKRVALRDAADRLRMELKALAPAEYRALADEMDELDASQVAFEASFTPTTESHDDRHD